MTQLHRNLLLLVFGLSGATALIYEVVWSRLLQTIFGSTLYSTSTIFAAFLLGFSLGAFLLRNLADTTTKPLRHLALIELSIGLYGLSIARIFHAVNSIYMQLPSNALITLLLSFAVLLPPTILFGAIWPFVNSLYIREPGTVGTRTASLYSISSLGSALGAFASGFMLIPVFGFRVSSAIAGVMNNGAAIVLLLLKKLARRQQIHVMASINNENTANACWDNNLTLRRIEDSVRVDNPRHHHYWNRELNSTVLPFGVTTVPPQSTRWLINRQ